MFIPIGDDNSLIKKTPIVTYALIAINVLVWVLLQKMSGNSAFSNAFSTVPAEILTGHDVVTNPQVITDEQTGLQYHYPGLGETPIPVYLTLITSMFMHGGWMHLLGNMLYLFIFGDNIENLLGKTRFIFFYLGTGIIAGLSHVFSVYFAHQSSITPCLGASGAISAILGAYLILFPKARVKMLIFYIVANVPAFVVLGLWIGLQIFSSLGTSNDGVAYAAHIGGFIAGLLLVKTFIKTTTANVTSH
jgi:membrane associated rhomboid family serine protease